MTRRPSIEGLSGGWSTWRPAGRRGADSVLTRTRSGRALPGDLSPADRLDLLIRDANAEWPGAFGARTVFDRRAVAEDDPFGVGWEGLEGARAGALWRELTQQATPNDAGALLNAVAAGWELKLQPFEVGTIAPADRLVVVGPSAIAAAAARFAGARDLDWADQVVCLAAPPEHRQLAALALGVLRAGSIPVPPRYDQKDFRDASYWRLRRKLDVPKERFISCPGCESDEDGEPVYGWAGWDHLQRAQALAALYQDRKEHEGWPKERLVPMLAGLLELIPWVKQWHNEPSAEYGGLRLGDYFESYLKGECVEHALTEDDLRAWRPEAKARGAKKTAQQAAPKKPRQRKAKGGEGA